jgi:hypothetical protein
MTRYIGMDVHKRQVEICIMDQEDKVLKRIRCACTRELPRNWPRGSSPNEITWPWKQPRTLGRWRI